jgi:hypothetical protein
MQVQPYQRWTSFAKSFKNALKTYLLNHCFYSVGEFLLLGTHTNPNQLYHIIHE